MIHRFQVSLILSIAVFVASPRSAVHADDITIPAQDIPDLIRKLDGTFRERQQASRSLEQVGEIALPYLRRATRQGNAQTVTTSRRLLSVSRDQGQGRLLKRVAVWAKNREADLLTEAFCGNNDQVPEAAWQSILDLRIQLVAWEKRTHALATLDPESPGSGLIFPRDLQKAKKDGRISPHNPNRQLNPDDYFQLIACSELRGRPEQFTGFAACSGDIELTVSLAVTACIFSNGNVRLSGPNRSIIICDGNYIGDSVIGTDCLIICRGSVRSDGGFPRCVVLAGGDIDSGRDLRGSTLRAGGKIRFKRDELDQKGLIFHENDADALDAVRFFEIDREGLAVSAAVSGNGVRVDKLTPDKPFAKAGFQKGDIITAVADEPVKSPEAFRKLLRRSVVLGGELFTVLRGNDKLDVPIYFPE